MNLLAKSPRGDRRLTLLQHLNDTEQAAAALFRAGTRWSRTYPRFFRLRADDHPRFLLNLRLAGLFHDIGKANEDFQKAMLARGKFLEQSLRHEHLSALLLCEPAVRAWLERGTGAGVDVDVDVITAAVLSHHLKAGEDGDWKVLQPKHATPTPLFFDDPQVRAALLRVSEVAGIPPWHGGEAGAGFPANRYLDDAWTPAWSALFSQASRFRAACRRDPARLRLTLAVKAALIVSDSVSSGIAREGLSLSGWIEEVAHAAPLGPCAVRRDVLDPRVKQIERVRPFSWHSFQSGAAAVGRRGLLLAACGAGKTLAAWKWAEAVTESEEIGRVIFLYPTRGTATEGFRDYVAHAPEGDAALVHGTSTYELTGMQANPPESLRGKAVVDEGEARLFAIGLWSKRYFSATVDQFLGFIEHGYGGMCLLPALADSAVIFDEVHSYDRQMWNALVTFLERFDVPVLCMTATLPPRRREQLEQHLTTYPTTADRAELVDLEEKERHLRYRLVASTREQAVSATLAAVQEGRRVLWVVNTVRRCQELAGLLAARLAAVKLDLEVIVYHSRFRLQDRQQRHRQTVDAFRASGSAGGGGGGGGGGDDGGVTLTRAIAVTTQVCEMSLDLDADLLITEHAPISSLVQRFGRANRHLARGPAFRATLLTYSPESSLPYDPRELAAASAFLTELAELGRAQDGGVSQKDLADGLEKHAPPERAASRATRFTEGGYFATPGSLRDSDDSGSAAILDSDLAEYARLTRAKEPTDGLVLNVPRKHAWPSEDPRIPTWLRLADGARYDPWLGFLVEESGGGSTNLGESQARATSLPASGGGHE